MTNENNNEIKISSADEYFAQNAKFFGVGDVNAKKAYFTLGQYTKKVLECAEKQPEEKFQTKLNRLVMGAMTYRVFGDMIKLLDDMALRCDPKIFYKCSGVPKQYMIQSNMPSDKKSLSPADANLAFSLGLCQKF